MSKWAFTGGGAHPAGVIHAICLPPELDDNEEEVVALIRSRLAAAAARNPERPVPTGCPFDLFRPGLVVEPAVNRDYAIQKIQVSNSRRWAESHGRQVTPPPLNAKVELLIKEWFRLVDRDSSGTLDVAELEVALKSAHIPCTQNSLTEMLELLDFNQDGVVDWTEFHTFISFQVHAGQDLLAGELELPSGLCLPLGPMIHKLRRQLVMDKIFDGGRNRRTGIGIAKSYLDVMKAVSHADMTPAAQYTSSSSRRRKPASKCSSSRESPSRRSQSSPEKERLPGSHSTLSFSLDPQSPSPKAQPQPGAVPSRASSMRSASFVDAPGPPDGQAHAAPPARPNAVRLPYAGAAAAAPAAGRFDTAAADQEDMERALLRYAAASTSRPASKQAARSPRPSVTPRTCSTSVPHSLAVLVRATQQARTMSFTSGAGAAAAAVQPSGQEAAAAAAAPPGSPSRFLPDSPTPPRPAALAAMHAALPPRSGTAPANFYRGADALSPKPPTTRPPARPSTVSTAAVPASTQQGRCLSSSWSEPPASPPLSPYLFPAPSGSGLRAPDGRLRGSLSSHLHASPSPKSAARTSTQFVRASLQRDSLPHDAILMSLPRQSGVAVAHTLRLLQPASLDGRISSSAFTLVVGRNGF